MSVKPYCEYRCDMCGRVETVPFDSIPEAIATYAGVQFDIRRDGDGDGGAVEFVSVSPFKSHDPHLDLCAPCLDRMNVVLVKALAPLFEEGEKGE